MASSPMEILLEMGFPRSRAEKSLVVTGNKGAEAAMEWLLAHSDDPEIDDPIEVEEMESTPVSNSEKSQSECPPSEPANKTDSGEKEADMQPDDSTGTASQAHSLRCDECGKLFKSDVEIEYHAVKSGHKSFSESTEEIKPLTEEEKKEKLRLLEEKIRQRRMLKEDEERKERVEKEKVRRRTGQELVEIKKRMEEEEMKRIADQRRKEKLEDKLARQRVLEQIQRDKEARKVKFGGASDEPEIATSSTVQSPAAPTEQAPVVKKDYAETKLQIRLTNGQTLTQSFGSKEELAAVRLYIEMNRTDGGGPFTIMTNFPKKIFMEDDMEKPLYELGLVPSAVLILRGSKS